MVSDMMEWLIAFLICNAVWVSWGAGESYRKYSCKGKSYETSAKNSVSRYQTSCLPSPECPFFCLEDRKPKL